MNNQVNDLNINWEEWFNQQTQCSENYRDKYLVESDYQENFNIFINGIRSVTDGFQKYKSGAKTGQTMAAGRRRIIDVLDLMSLQYSAGGNIAFMQETYSYIVNWTEEYAELHARYHQSPEAKGRFVWHIALGTEDYWFIALRLICFGLLMGYADQMYRIMPVIDYTEAMPDGQEKDGLIERLVASFVVDRGILPSKARRHLPYRKLMKVFDAAVEKRPVLILQYLEDWYEASRREPFYDQHPQSGIRTGVSYFGYWSWEAATVTWLLDIDDTTYRDHEFYPKDLVDFARNHSNKISDNQDFVHIKIKGGDKCTRKGYWVTPAKPEERKYFEQGDVLPILKESDWGEVFWQYDGE